MASAYPPRGAMQWDTPLQQYIDSKVAEILWSGTQAQYDAIVVKNPKTLYVIVG